MSDVLTHNGKHALITDGTKGTGAAIYRARGSRAKSMMRVGFSSAMK